MSNFLKLFALAVIAAGGYWSWYANYGPNPNEPVGVSLTRWMPGPIRAWGCDKLNARFQGNAPTECSPVAGSTSI